MIYGINTLVEVISADINHLTENLMEDHSIRLYSRGGHFTKEQLLPVYFMLISGCTDSDNYNNFLFGLRDDIKKSQRPFAFIDTPLSEPNSARMLDFSGIDRSSDASIISGLCLHINIKNDPNRTLLAQKVLGDMLSLCRTDIFTMGIALVDKLNMIANGIGTGTEKIPLIMYYGMPTPQDTLFLCYAQRCGFDVVCICPDKSISNTFALCPFADKLQKIELPDSCSIIPFPNKMVKAKIATVAYNAERELDDMLYGGDTMFRDRQFTKMDSAVLRTTFDEIDILWDQPAKFRSGFAVRGDRVIVPTIFAKINGVENGDLKDYWNMVENMLTPNSLYLIKSPSYKKPTSGLSRAYAPYHDGKQLDIPKLMRSPLNKYGFLSTELQNLIFEKMQSIINDGMLVMESDFEMIDYVMYAGLNIDRRVLELMQKYDFTKDIPKIIIVDAIEEPYSKLECTQVLLFSYMGFDVLMFSPAGYRDIEAYVSTDAFEAHTFNEFKYNVSVPRFKIPDAPRNKKAKKSLFENLFKKGR